MRKKGHTAWGNPGNSSETFGFLASPCGARTHNGCVSGSFAFGSFDPSLPLGQTSDTRRVLAVMLERRLK